MANAFLAMQPKAAIADAIAEVRRFRGRRAAEARQDFGDRPEFTALSLRVFRLHICLSVARKMAHCGLLMPHFISRDYLFMLDDDADLSPCFYIRASPTSRLSAFISECSDCR